MHPKLVIIIPLLVFMQINAQQNEFFINPQQYPFIQFDSNSIVFPGSSESFEQLFIKLDSLVFFGEGKINIVHIGGSHIQADVYTHEIRKHLQTIQYGMNGGRGLIFPYRIAHTNNPENYRVSYKGDWEYCKNTQLKRNCTVGLSGISVSTSDNNASITINPNNDKEIQYAFCRLKVFHSLTKYKIATRINDILYSGNYDTLNGCTVFQVPESYFVKLLFNRPDSINESISIYGISLENDNPGIVYNAVGVNGAKLSSYISSEFYGQQLAAINPDLIIFSIGTNDGNTREFNELLYSIEYARLIELSKIAAPDAAILITVPNDCYLYKRYVNKNTALMSHEIYKIAKAEDYGVWNFYSVMGGLNSSEVWHRNKLMRDDRIHFTKQGYILKGDLFVAAFLKAWEKNIDKRLAKNIFK